MADVHENTSFIEGNYENELVIVLDSVFNKYPNTLIQAKILDAHEKSIK